MRMTSSSYVMKMEVELSLLDPVSLQRHLEDRARQDRKEMGRGH